MIRVPTRVNRNQRRTSLTYSSPAPYGGLNLRDAISSMDEKDALILDNIFPDTTEVRLRKGHTSHVTGFTGTPETLMAYHGPSTTKLFASGDLAVYDVTGAGARGAAAFSALTNDRWQHINFGNSAGNFLVVVNGADAYRTFDGSSWATFTLTGPGAGTIIHLNEFKKRIFYIEKNSLSFWYPPVSTISGTVQEFKLDGLSKLGGFLMAMGTWSRDSGDGLNDLAVFLTSKGEAIIFQGIDPSSATTWSLVGVFRVGAPIGRRCMFKVGGELILITEDGFTPISRAIAGARTTEAIAISDKIQGGVVSAVRAHRSKFGWQPILYPGGNMGLFNIPVIEGGEAFQYVVNTTTGAWCRFTGLNAACWEVYSDSLYFGGATAVFRADNGLNDDGANIEGQAKPAFNYLGRKGMLKSFKMIRPIFTTQGSVGLALNLNVDFKDRTPTSSPTFVGSAGSPWNTSPWNTSPWSREASIRREWLGAEGLGHSATPNFKVAVKGVDWSWISTDWIFEPGSPI